MLNIPQFREEIIRVALETIELYSPAAEELVLGTGLKESGLRHLVQLEGGPAKGLFQMEPFTHDDIWDNFLKYKPDIAQRIRILCDITSSISMVGNLWYAAAMCRIHYYRVPEALPAQGDIPAQALYWKANYNTFKGKGTTQQYINVWNKYMGGTS